MSAMDRFELEPLGFCVTGARPSVERLDGAFVAYGALDAPEYVPTGSVEAVFAGTPGVAYGLCSLPRDR